MTARCKVCSHPRRAEVDAALVAGEAKRSIAKRFKFSPSSIDRHAAHKVGLGAARAKVEAAHYQTVFEHVQAMIADVQVIFDDTKHKTLEVSPLEAARELGRLLELKAKITGELVRKSETVLLTRPQTPREALDLLDRMRPALEAQAAEDAKEALQ